MKLLNVYGNPEVAEIAVIQFRDSKAHIVEIVDGLAPPLTRSEKWILNISTQFGCPVGCPFCDAAMQYEGNLTVDELLAQIQWGLDRHPGMAERCQKLKVHFSRMGEPSLNNHVLDAIEQLPEMTHSSGLWCCLATVCPKGRDSWFGRLIEIKENFFQKRFQLQFSVQSTDEQERDRLIPVPHWSLKELARFGREFFRPGDRKVVLNFALVCGASFDANTIGDLFDPGCFALKLTPVNPTATGNTNGVQTILRSERNTTILSAIESLKNLGFDVVISIGDGREDQIGSNCGQAVRVERFREDIERRGNMAFA